MPTGGRHTSGGNWSPFRAFNWISLDTRRLLRRLASGSLQNVKFAQFRRLVEAFGFQLKRVAGSHHIFYHPDIQETVNIQEVSGEAKPYQIRQFLRLVGRYNLQLEDEP